MRNSNNKQKIEIKVRILNFPRKVGKGNNSYIKRLRMRIKVKKIEKNKRNDKDQKT